jgi:hypothetical protein
VGCDTVVTAVNVTSTVCGDPDTPSTATDSDPVYVCPATSPAGFAATCTFTGVKPVGFTTDNQAAPGACVTVYGNPGSAITIASVIGASLTNATGSDVPGSVGDTTTPNCPVSSSSG